MDKQEQEHLVRELIEEYVESELGRKTDALREQIAALETRIGVGRLEQAEREVEGYVKQGVSYNQAFEWVTTSLEERERERQARREQARREKVTAELEALDEAQEMRILKQEEDDA